MKKVRSGIFETKSSSTHSLTIVSKEDFEKWKRGELVFNRWDDELVPIKNMEREYTQEEYIDYLDDKTQKVGNGYIFKDNYYKSYDEILPLNLITDEEMKEYLDEDEDSEFRTYEEWRDNDYLEIFTQEYTTPKGDEIVVFGQYGYDG